MSRVGKGRQASVSWLPCQFGQVPYNAILAGKDLFIVRARTGNDVTPGMVRIGYSSAKFPYDGREEFMINYEVLCDTGLHVFGPEISWKHMGNGAVPSGAIVGGNTSDNEPLYIARAYVNGELCVGKVCQSHKCAYIPNSSQEHRVNNYEVLCFHE